jgi:5-methylcytosine-specific restriction protein A
VPWNAPRHSDLQRRRLGRRHFDADYEARRRADPALALANKLRSSARWKKVRALHLAREPLCQDCAEHGVAEPAAQVHHMIPVAERPDLAFDRENLRSLCTTCHARREAEERRRQAGP